MEFIAGNSKIAKRIFEYMYMKAAMALKAITEQLNHLIVHFIVATQNFLV